MMKKIFIGILFLSLLSVLNCSTARMGLVGTRNIDYSATYIKGNQVTDDSKLILFLVIPVKCDDFNMVEIIDKVMAKEGYDFMTNVEISSMIVPLVFITYSKVEITGTGWKRQDGKYSINKDMSPLFYKVGKENGIISVTKITGEDAERL